MADRLPPQNLDAEQSVLGSLLIDRDAIIQIAPIVKSEDFYQPSHGTIYQAILDLYERQEPTDVITLTDELRRHDHLDAVGGVSYLTSLVSIVPTAVHVEYYARIVERTATLRRLIDAGTKVVGIGFREGIDADAAIDEAQQTIFDISMDRSPRGFVSIETVLEELFDTITDSAAGSSACRPVFRTSTACWEVCNGRICLSLPPARVLASRRWLFRSATTHRCCTKRRSGSFRWRCPPLKSCNAFWRQRRESNSHKLKLGQVNEAEWALLSRAFGKLSEAQFLYRRRWRAQR